MFLKIVKDTTVVDATKKLTYVRQNPGNKKIILCEPEFANGIVSSDGSVIWHLKGLPEFISGNYETVSVVEVCEDEYNSITASLLNGEDVPEEVRKTLTSIEMMEKLTDLTNKNAKLEAEVQELKRKLAETGV